MLKYICPVLILFVFLLTEGCRKDEQFNDDPSFKLQFSVDTLYFDTVFTTIGSITLQAKVFNNSNRIVNISSVSLGGGLASNFRINVNGISGTTFSNIEIGAKDSIFIFAEVTVDPNNSNNPVVIEDSINFYVNGNHQKIHLVACGQDAYFHFPDHPETQYLPAYSLVSGVWANDKPHVVYGYAVVDEDSILTIPAGTKIYMHNNAVLWVYDGGSLRVHGAKDNEVVFQGDRLDDYYKDLPGMWGKIWLSAGSKDNIIDYAIIKNGRIGVHVDTLGASINPTLTITNTIIDNMSTACFVAQGSFVKAENCVFANAGYFSVLLNIGGSYDFRHCTIGNYWTHGTRSASAVVLNNYYKDIYGNFHIRDLTNAYFGNCILYGANQEELLLDKFASGGVFNFNFDHCLLKTGLNVLGSGFSGCIKNQNPSFSDTQHLDFSLKTGSAAIDAGSISATGLIMYDIDGNPRISGLAPDMGAYELQ